MPVRFPLLCATTLWWILLTPAVSRADTDELCASAYEGAQLYRTQGKFRLSRAQLDTCLAACPAPLKTDCSTWKREIESAMPRVVFLARDASGHDLQGARVLIRELEESRECGATPIAMDPGQYHLEFVHRDVHILQTIQLHAGSGKQEVVSVFATQRSVTPRAMVEAAEVEHAEDRSGWETTGWVVLASAVVAGAAGHAYAAYLRADCKPNCSEGQVEVVQGMWWTGGLLATAGTGLLIFGLSGRY